MEREVQIPMPDGNAGGFLYADAARKGRGVLYLPDIGGIRKAARADAARLASHGYSVLLPNIFFRHGNPPFFTPPLDFTNPETRKTFGALSASVPASSQGQDCARYLAFL